VRILYVTNGFPYPLTSGYLRHYFLIRELAERHAVTLLAVVGPGFEDAHAAELADATERILTFPAARGRSRGRKITQRLAGLLPGGLADAPAARLGRAAAELHGADPFDAVLFSGKRTFPALASIPAELPVVVDVCDTASARVRGSMRFASPVRLPVLALDFAELRRIERSLARRAASLLFASARDRDLLLRDVRSHGLDPRTHVVPNGVDLDVWRRSTTALGAGRIVFTGKMDYPPNEDAALVLCRQVLPIVRRSFPRAELTLVGRDPTERLRRAGRADGVTVTGYVDDVKPYLEQARVFAAPLRFGAGIQNKLLEAMAMEVPVVASPLAADGLRLADGTPAPVTVARSPDHLAGRLVEQLAATGAPPDHAARAFVEEHFSWRESGLVVEDALRAAVVAGVAHRVSR